MGPRRIAGLRSMRCGAQRQAPRRNAFRRLLPAAATDRSLALLWLPASMMLHQLLISALRMRSLEFRGQSTRKPRQRYATSMARMEWTATIRVARGVWNGNQQP